MTKVAVRETYQRVRAMSFERKQDPIVLEDDDLYLDMINILKRKLKTGAAELSVINEKLEALTWADNLQKEELMVINDIISAARDLHFTLIRHYEKYAPMREENLAIEELDNLKEQIDLLKENYQDVESAFFILPEMPDFKDTTIKLSLM